MVHIRNADPAEVDLLSELALRSKGHWGYDDAFLEACRDELTFSAQRLAAERVRIAEQDSTIVGLASVLVHGEDAELMDLFVEPAHIGAGVGGALLDDAIAIARIAGARRLRIEADPNAASWYAARGAVVGGRAPSGSIPSRTLPVLEIDLA